MAGRTSKIEAYLEIGKKRTFAGAIDWPGWCRSARDEGSALEALLWYGPRYARVLRGTRLGFAAPADASALRLVERLGGDATTDFGAPGAAPSADSRPVDDAELRRFETILRASWRAFDAAVDGARGKELRTGPRGGGRELEAIVRHVLDADGGYLSRLASKHSVDERADLAEELARARGAIVGALDAAVREGVPPAGPRGGKRWTPRYFVRRSAWHVLDHAWEIEDRAS